MFPNASGSLTDRPSTDSDPYIVTHKIRGNPYRREVHYRVLPPQQSLQWPDKHYMQVNKSKTPGINIHFSIFSVASIIE